MINSRKALFLGLNTIDIQFHVKGYPSANTKIKAHHNTICVGGPATNAAITAAFLGCDTTLITPVGINPLSPYIQAELKEHRVKLIDPIANKQSAPVFASIITDDSNGDRTIFSYMPSENEELVSTFSLIDFADFQIALYDGFYPNLAEKILKSLKESGVPVVFDCGSWKPGIENLLTYADIAICSNDFMPPDCTSKTDIFNLLNKSGIRKIAITRGHEPILFMEGENIQELPVVHVRAKDTSGAGDIFHGAFCYFYLLNADFRFSLQKASEVAGFSCRYQGTRSWMGHFEKQIED